MVTSDIVVLFDVGEKADWGPELIKDRDAGVG
jgi:hypothetical protein